MTNTSKSCPTSFLSEFFCLFIQKTKVLKKNLGIAVTIDTKAFERCLPNLLPKFLFFTKVLWYFSSLWESKDERVLKTEKPKYQSFLGVW